MNYIKVDKALESIDLIAKNDGEKFDKDSARYAIQTTETEDVVPVVRCKDCKHLMFSDCYGECSKGYMGIVSPNDYCSRGERK